MGCWVQAGQDSTEDQDVHNINHRRTDGYHSSHGSGCQTSDCSRNSQDNRHPSWHSTHYLTDISRMSKLSARRALRMLTQDHKMIRVEYSRRLFTRFMLSDPDKYWKILVIQDGSPLWTVMSDLKTSNKNTMIFPKIESIGPCSQGDGRRVMGILRALSW